MNQAITRYLQRPPLHLVAVLFSLCIAALLFKWQGRLGFNLWDEGFLWYGVQRAMQGEVPLRDFMAYDPGRYYWCAALMRLAGSQSLFALRAAEALLQVLTLYLVVRLIQRRETRPQWYLWLVATATCAAWMVPSYKQFDRTASVCLIAVLTFLIRRPDVRRHLVAGTVVGLVAVFGRNHGLYGLAGSVGAIIYLAIRGDYARNYVRPLAAWMAGIVLGYLPVLLMFALVPGFAGAFRDSIRLLLEMKSTNIPLPVPWHVSFHGAPFTRILAWLSLDFFFIVVVLFGIGGMLYAVWRAAKGKIVPPVLVACAFLSLPFSHYTYSRADVEHLAPSVFPFLIASFALLATRSAKTRGVLATLLLVASLLVTLPLQPGWQHFRTRPWVDVDLGGSAISVDPSTASDLATLNRLAGQFAPDGGSFVVTPVWPGAYAALQRKSPMWEIYALVPRGAAFQEEEIARIKAAHPGFAVVIDFPLDSQEALRFRNTHPLIDAYIRSHFTPLPADDYTRDSFLQLYKSR